MRSAEGDLKRLPGLVTELISEGAGVLLVVGSAAIKAATEVSQSIPIVGIDLGVNPVRAGYVTSLRRPGGNVTGLFLNQPAIVGKWVDLLRDAQPSIGRLAFLSDSGTALDQVDAAKEVAAARGCQSIVLDVRTVQDFDEVFRALGERPRTGIVQLAVSTYTVAQAQECARAALKYMLPMIVPVKSFMKPGVLMSYGPIEEQYFPRAVVLADRILRGERAGELPIEGPDRFELVLNMATAKQLQLNVPKSLHLRADQVIDS